MRTLKTCGKTIVVRSGTGAGGQKLCLAAAVSRFPRRASILTENEGYTGEAFSGDGPPGDPEVKYLSVRAAK